MPKPPVQTTLRRTDIKNFMSDSIRVNARPAWNRLNPQECYQPTLTGLPHSDVHKAASEKLVDTS
ncbi:hypothetical protein AA0522_0098 [Gluconacetobacter liquefaciens NRIC 0522]|nr:hypothetical protein AA0522_0098 [Gluconacetobacter liquefaciens NRIC 0522]